MADFFDKQDEATVEPEAESEEEAPAAEEAEPEVEKVKVGEAEYTQDELNKLVELGKIGQEAEERYKTKIDRVWPEYTKTRQELKQLQEEMEAGKRQAVEQKAQAGQELTEQEQVDQMLAQAEKLGLVTTRKAREVVLEVLEARDLLDTCKDLTGEFNGKDGRPAFSTQDILAHMQETGIKNPEKAYKDKFETELDRWKEDKLAKAKPKGVVSEESSPAGGKEPITKIPAGEDALRIAIRNQLYGE